MTYTRVDRGGIATFERPGHGPPVLVLPGVMADAKGWMPVADAIDRPNPVIIVNRRGRAPSRDIGADYGVPDEIADLVGIAATLGEPAHLFGWSYGGLIAIEAAAAGLPIRSLTAYEPVSRPFVPAVIGPIRDALLRGDAGSAVEIINRDVSGFDQAYVEALRATPAWPELCRLARPLGSELSAIDRYEPTYDRYASIACPITLILGERSRAHAAYGAAFTRFARAMPRAAVVLLPEEGHLAHVTRPAALGRCLAEAVGARPLPYADVI